MSSYIETDVLILGCGIAGGVAALQLADAGVSVVVVTRSDEPKESNTYHAQGGIIYRGKDDSPELLTKDVIRAGADYCHPASVKILATEGPDLVRKILIEKLNVPFDRTADGDLSLVREGSHLVPRIVHAADATGSVIQSALIKAVADHPKVTLLTSHTAVDLLTPSHHSLDRLDIYKPRSCIGAYLLDQKKERVNRCLAKQTILATGGLGQIFLRTTNSAGIRGDGLSMAYRAGARVLNCEFIQFHPTAFYHRNAPCFLISEAVRGEGGRLVHADGEPFMQKYDPEWKDLAPRDIVARSIHQEMLKRDVPNVYLDLRSYISPERIKEHFPSIQKSCLAYGIEISRDLVPVVPAAHYFCGGVWVDAWGETTVDNLYAVGEVACTGVHGANRLASTSLLEGLVWGERAARRIQRTIADPILFPAEKIPVWHDTGRYEPDPALISQDMSSIKHVMWNYVGLVRTTHRLQRAIHELRHLEYEIERFYRAACLTDELIGLRNAVRTALIVTISAWENNSNMGCHYRK